MLLLPEFRLLLLLHGGSHFLNFLTHCSVGFCILKLKTWQLASYGAEKKARSRRKGEKGRGEASYDVLQLNLETGILSP